MDNKTNKSHVPNHQPDGNMLESGMMKPWDSLRDHHPVILTWEVEPWLSEASFTLTINHWIASEFLWFYDIL